MNMGFFHDCDIDERFQCWDDAVHSADGALKYSEWHKYDLDQRRFITVRIQGEDHDGDIVDNVLDKYIHSLDRDVMMITASMAGTLISSSSDTNSDDNMRFPAYPTIDSVPEAYRTRTVELHTLVELERIGSCVDLVADRESVATRCTQKRYIFKRSIHWKQFLWTWHEMNCMMRLPSHPNMVSLDRLVTAKCGPDERDRIVGFTTPFIPGKTLSEPHNFPERLFKLKYMHQLMNVVDDLNLRFGISHQDIAPDNIIIDSDTDTLKLFDFNFAGRIGWPGHRDNLHVFRHREGCDDVKGVIFCMYEILTGDWQYNSAPLHKFPMDEILHKGEWARNDSAMSLDRPLPEFLEALRAWVSKRSEQKASHYTQLPEHIDWPLLEGFNMPHELSPTDHPVKDGQIEWLSWSRREARKHEWSYLSWERPAHDRIPQGVYVLGNGAMIPNAEL